MRRPSDRTPAHVREHNGRTFDASPSTDDRNLDHPIRPLLAARTEGAPITPVRKVWRRGAVLDQGPDGACVGHGWAGDAAATPERVDWSRVTYSGTEPFPRDTHEAAFWIYRAAQRVDEWAGEDYSGTSVNAGAKVMRDLGLIDSWRWCQTADDMRDTLITTGPVVIAVPWLDRMFDTDQYGELHIAGDEVGWHCLMVNGYDPALALNGDAPTEKARVLQSWGTSWGLFGSAWVDFTDLWNLIDANDGDCCVPLGRSAY